MRWVVDACLDHGLNTNDEVPDLPDQVENYMDYNIDSCANMFTLGQRERVMERIAAFRATLVSAANLDFTGCEPFTGIAEREQAPWLAEPGHRPCAHRRGRGGAAGHLHHRRPACAPCTRHPTKS